MGKKHQQHAAPKPPAHPAWWAVHGALVSASCFFLVTFGLLWRVVELHLLYHGGGAIQSFPIFQWGRDLFLEHLRFPGGLSRYVADLLAQGLFHSWLGALVITGVAALVHICATLLFRSLNAPRWAWLGLLPGLLLLALCALYSHGLLATVNLLTGLAAAAGWGRWRSDAAWLRLGVGVTLAAALYVSAAGAVVVFILVAATVELHQRRWPLALVLLLLAAGIPLAIGWWGYGLTHKAIWLGLLPFKWDPDLMTRLERGLLLALCLVMPAAIWGLWLVRAIAGLLRSKAPDPASKDSSPTAPNRWLALLEIALPVLAALAVIHYLHDRPLKAILAVDYFASQRQWPAVIEAAKGNPHNPYVLSAVNRAVFHTGQLGRDLPLPQKPDCLLLPLGDARAHWNKVDLYLELGSLNMALHHASEAVGFYEPRPFLLRRLAIINLALGNTGTASIYLRALARTPFHSAWAKDYLQRMEADPELRRDEELNRLRRFKPPRNEMVPLPADRMLASVLEYGVENRMAAEYLVVLHMLGRELQPLAKHFPRLADYGYTNLPPLYDEAAVLAAKRIGVEPARFKPAPSPEAVARFEQFMAATLAAGWTPESSPELLPKQYTNTYFYYFFSQQ